MMVNVRLYRGLEIHPLVFPHRSTAAGFNHNYDEGFDAAVRIQEPREPKESTGSQRSRVFNVDAVRPFASTGDARRASVAFAESLIDNCPSNEHVLDMKS